MQTEPRREVAGAVRAELARRQVGQRQVAEALGISQPAVSRRLAGEVAFNVDELAAVADLLGMDARDLMPTASAPTP